MNFKKLFLLAKFDDAFDKDVESYEFSTSWSAPIEFVDEQAAKNPTISVTLESVETFYKEF